MKKECIAMILAGGGGSRLKPLTRRIAKPAVLFGGKYRIIDFALSNCINSGIDTMGILVQYESLSLSSYVSSGNILNQSGMRGSITILPPQTHENGGCWYKGTANAVFQNTEFTSIYDADYVLILSADQVYKMDYSKMIQFHLQKKADVTIAATRVPLDEAYRFGILDTNKDSRIYDFEEKPSKPRNNLASMGIYIFNRKVLKDVLDEDEANPESSNDFGKDILPRLVMKSGYDLFAYEFNGYWRDVGTVKSFWEAHMDLLEEENGLSLHDPSWKIYSENTVYPPLYVNHTASVNASLLGAGCYIQGEVTNSVLFPGVFIGRNAKVADSVIMSNVTIEANSIINKSIICSNVIVKSNCYIGSPQKSADDVLCIDEGNIVTENSVLTAC